MKSRKSIAYIMGLGLSLVTGVLFSACSGSTCTDRGNCPENAGSAGLGGSSAGAGASSGHGGTSESGSPNGGASGGSSSQAGASAGANSEAGAGGATPCDGTCTGSTPVCDAATNTCVECVDKTTCSAPTPACDTTSNTCVECTAKADCMDSAKPLCDTTAEKCVACLQQSDCTSATASACNGGACTACTKDADCSNIAGKGVCDAGTCVQCTGAKFSACGESAGTPLVCDSLMHTCTTNKQKTAGQCQPCVSDAQCKPGNICVEQQYGSPEQNVGYFCEWKKGDTADGAPSTCLPGADPYSATITNATSIDGVTSDICTLRSSTCVALNQFSNKNCANPVLPDDSLCGFAPTKDSKCAQADVGVYRCTMTCLGNDDCPAPSSCDSGSTPHVCTLN